jgi:hypothetical protein
MPQWEYKAVFLRIFPQQRESGPKPGKVMVALAAAIEPLVAGQEVKLLAEYLDMQQTKGWELLSIVNDPRPDRGACFVFRKPASATAADKPSSQPGVPAAPLPAQHVPPPAAATPQPLPAPGAAPPAFPAPPAHAPAVPPPPTRASGVQPIGAPPAVPPRMASSPGITPPGVTNVAVQPPSPVAAPLVAPPATPPAAPPAAAGPPPLPPPTAPAAVTPASPPAPVAPPGVAPPPRIGGMGIPAPPPGAPSPISLMAQQPPPAPAGPTPEEVAAHQRAQEEVSALLYSIEAAARGNPQGWAEMSFIAKICGQSNIGPDRMYELLEYLESSRYIEWSPATQPPKRGGWVRRHR